MKARVAVVVLGDLARSPRMLNHARTLAARGYPVSLVGYRERPLDLPADIRVCPLQSGERVSPERSRLTFLVGSAMRMGLLFFRLLGRLLREKPRYILVQNPPAFPTLTAAWLAAMLLHARWIVDWHNYGYSMLALRLTPTHPVVKLAAWYEFRAGRLADDHLCVSRAMRKHLQHRAGIKARLLYDRPVKIAETVAHPNADLLLVCPSGWTADEDMGLLLDALAQLPSQGVKIYLTGDGPLRASFDARLDALRAGGIDIVTGYLPLAEYHALLARADLGLSLHHSSSGFDLAMKVADLFAARVPVCAWNYGGSLPEQVEDGVTGFVFKTATELSTILARLIADRSSLDIMRTRIEETWQETWDQAWEQTAADLFVELGDRR